jgi:uncharacterized protein (TIGR02246 family)
MTISAIIAGTAAILFAGCLAVGAGLAPASSQERGLEAQSRETQQEYVAAWTDGNIDALVELFTEDAIYWPASGGRIEGQEELRRHFESTPTPTAAEISSTHTEQMGELVVDVGTISMTMPEEAGGEVQAEYVLLAEQSEDGLRIRRLVGFPTRETPRSQ